MGGPNKRGREIKKLISVPPFIRYLRVTTNKAPLITAKTDENAS